MREATHASMASLRLSRRSRTVARALGSAARSVLNSAIHSRYCSSFSRSASTSPAGFPINCRCSFHPSHASVAAWSSDSETMGMTTGTASSSMRENIAWRSTSRTASTSPACKGTVMLVKPRGAAESPCSKSRASSSSALTTGRMSSTVGGNPSICRSSFCITVTYLGVSPKGRRS